MTEAAGSRGRGRRDRARPAGAGPPGRAAGPRTHRGQHLPRSQPAAVAGAGVRRAGRGQALVAAGRTVPAGAARALAARVLHPRRRPERADRLRSRPDPGRALVHHPPGGRDPARQGDLLAVRVVPEGRAGHRALRRDAGRARARRACRRYAERIATRRETLGDAGTTPAPDRHPLRQRAAVDLAATPARARRATRCGCAPTASCPTTSCCTCACWPTRQRHDVARRRRWPAHGVYWGWTR